MFEQGKLWFVCVCFSEIACCRFNSLLNQIKQNLCVQNHFFLKTIQHEFFISDCISKVSLPFLIRCKGNFRNGHLGQTVGPPIIFRLKYLNSYWIDYREGLSSEDKASLFW